MNRINNPANGAQIRFNDTLARIANGVLNLSDFGGEYTIDNDDAQIDRCSIIIDLLKKGTEIFISFDKNQMFITETSENMLKQAKFGFRTGDVKSLVNAGKIEIVEGNNENKYFVLRLI